MTWLLLALLAAGGTAGQPPAASTIELEIRVFDGSEDVTADTRVAVFRAGERGAPLARLALEGGRKTLNVPEGFYDVQAVRERDGRVLTIRWAERLVVMRYPDEGGRHLQVINLRPGFGALQVRATDDGPLPDLALFAEGGRDKPSTPPAAGTGYALFVVPAGRYDLRIGPAQQPTWHDGMDVPRDRTRLWVLPPAARSDDAAAGHHSEDHHDQRDHKQDVNHATGNLEHETEQPQKQQHHDDCPQHQPVLLPPG